MFLGCSIRDYNSSVQLNALHMCTENTSVWEIWTKRVQYKLDIIDFNISCVLLASCSL